MTLLARYLFGDNFTTATQGGFTVYYVSDGPGKATAFKPVGFSVSCRAQAYADHMQGFPHASWGFDAAREEG